MNTNYTFYCLQYNSKKSPRQNFELISHDRYPGVTQTEVCNVNLASNNPITMEVLDFKVILLQLYKIHMNLGILMVSAHLKFNYELI